MTLILISGLLGMTASISKADTNNRILDIEEYVTPSGIPFWHIEDQSLPIQTIHFAFRGAGAVRDPEGKAGLAQLLSNTMDEGAGARDAQEFQKTLDDHAIDLSFNHSRDHFTGKMKTLSRHSDLAFELLRDAVNSPTFADEAVNRMREANLSRIRSSLANSNWLASRLMNDVYFQGHEYADNSGGTISGLMNITADDFRAFMKDHFFKTNLVVATAGNMSAEEAAEKIDFAFSKLPTGETLEGLNQAMPPEGYKKKAFETSSPQSVIQMVWEGMPKNDDDYYAYRVLNQILGGGGFSSLLMDQVREEKGLTYGIYSQPAFMDFANYLLIQSATSPENIEEMTIAIQDIIAGLKSENVDAVMLEEAKSYLIGSLPLRFSSMLSLSGAAIRMQLDGRSIDSLDVWAENIEAVTAEDIRKVANRIFENPQAAVTVIAGAVPSDQGFELVEPLPGVQ
jgi:zinc protease